MGDVGGVRVGAASGFDENSNRVDKTAIAVVIHLQGPELV